MAEQQKVDAINRITALHLNTEASQTSLLAHGGGGFRSVHRGMQVVYVQDHWVAVGCDEDEVVLANSSGNAISPLVCQQMKQL